MQHNVNNQKASPELVDQVSTVIFLHIPKTAGRSLYKIIRRQFGDDEVFEIDARYSQTSLGHFVSLPSSIRNSLRTVFGHMNFGLHEHLKSARYITLLRDPLERIISHYSYVKRTRDHYLHERVVLENMDLKDYVLSGLNNELDNGQTRLLADKKLLGSFGTVDDAVFESAKQNLSNHFIAVGTQERFGEFLQVLNQRLGWKVDSNVSENVSSTEFDRSILTDETLEIIEPFTRYDRELHDIANRMLDRHLGIQNTEEFHREYDEFSKVTISTNESSTSRRKIEPVFIVGAARSGTTALRKAIESTSDFCDIRKEGHMLYWLLDGVRKVIEQPQNYKQAFLPTSMCHNDNLNLLLEELSIMIDRFMKKINHNGERIRWIDKTPGLKQIRILPTVQRVFPHAKFIFMYRNPQNQVISQIKKHKPDRHHRELLADWVRVQKEFREIVKPQLNSNAVIEIRQEEMAVDPTAVAERIGRFLDLNGNDTIQIGEYLSSNRVNRTDARPNDQFNYNEEISPEFMQDVAEICGAEMLHWDIEIEAVQLA